MIYLQLFWSFLKIGFFSFGGTTMVPVINDEVLRFGWMTSGEVMDIVAIAEMTPGSLGINCATFVGLRTAGLAGSLAASLGVMVPSLTLCMLAARFIIKLKDTPALESAMSGVRPVCLGMVFSVGLTMGHSILLANNLVQWNMVFIAVITAVVMIRFHLSVPKTILLAAVLGLVFG